MTCVVDASIATLFLPTSPSVETVGVAPAIPPGRRGNIGKVLKTHKTVKLLDLTANYFVML